MYALSFAVVVCFLFALVLTPLSRDLARRWGILDLPDRSRKLHPGPIPRIGGIPIVLSCLATAGLLLFCNFQAGGIVRANLSIVARLAPAAVLVFAIGLYDDLRGLRPI